MVPIWLEVLQRQLGYTDAEFAALIKPESEWVEWDLMTRIPSALHQALWEALRSPTIYHFAPPIAGALEGVERLRSLGGRVVFVTSCVETHHDSKLVWLQKHLFLPAGRYQPDYIAASDKSLIRCDVMMDDRPKTIQQCSAVPLLGWFMPRLSFNEDKHGPKDCDYTRIFGWQSPSFGAFCQCIEEACRNGW